MSEILNLYLKENKKPSKTQENVRLDNSKNKFNVNFINEEPVNFHYFTFNRLINDGEITPINISQKSKIKDLSESLKNENDSLILYKKNLELYFHKPEKGERSSDFAIKITDIELLEQKVNANRVLLHFTSSEQEKGNPVEIKCSDYELDNLLEIILLFQILQTQTLHKQRNKKNKSPFKTQENVRFDNLKNKFSVNLINEGPANFNYSTLNELINDGKITSINISQRSKIKDLSESLKNENNSLILYQKNFGFYFHKPEKGKRSSDFANKIIDIELLEQKVNANRVLLHFASSEQKKENPVEINCSDYELDNLLEIILLFQIFQMEENIQNAQKLRNKNTADNRTIEKAKTQNPQDSYDNHSIHINAGPGGTVNFYPPHSRQNVNTESGESTVSNVPGFNYSVIPDPVPMRNIITSDLERDDYSVADTGNMPKRSPAPAAPTQTATETPESSDVDVASAETSESDIAEESAEIDESQISKDALSEIFSHYKDQTPDNKPTPKSEKKADKGQSGFEVFVTQLLPFIGIGALAVLMVFGATMTLPLTTGLFVLGGTMFLYKDATVRGSKNVFKMPHKYMNSAYKGYSAYRVAEKNRKLEAEMNLQRPFSSDKKILDNLKAKDAELHEQKSQKLQKAFLTKDEMENMSEENRKTLATIRYYEYMDKHKPLKIDNTKPREISNFGNTAIPEKANPETARTFSNDPDLNPKDESVDLISSIPSTIEPDGIHSGQGSLKGSEKFYQNQKLLSDEDEKDTKNKNNKEIKEQELER